MSSSTRRAPALRSAFPSPTARFCSTSPTTAARPGHRVPAGPPGSPAAGERPTGPGHGIVGMRERIAAFGGWLAAEPLADRGFRVNAEVPIEGAV